MKFLAKVWEIISSSRGWIAFIAFVFVVGIASGVIISLVNPEMSQSFFKSYGDSIQKISNHSGLDMSLFIFERNAAIVVGSFIFGILGLLPIFVVFINGMIFGMIFGFKDIYLNYSIIKILFLILPHGVFEISATLIGLGLSLKTWLHWLLVKKKKRETFLIDLKESLQAGVVVIGLLAIAALIEGVGTPALTCFLFHICF